MKAVLLLACLSMIAFDCLAIADQQNAATSSSSTAESQNAERPRANERLRSEERRKLRGELDDYARKYPDREQLDERRRMMLERMQERLRAADGIGAITRSEAQLRMPKLARYFDQIDTNDDGVITREELDVAHARLQTRQTVIRPDDMDSELRAVRPE